VAGRLLIVAGKETKDMFPRSLMENNQYSIEFSGEVDQLFQLLDGKHYDLLFIELDILSSNKKEDFYQTIKDKHPGMKIILITSSPGGWKVKKPWMPESMGVFRSHFRRKK